MSWGSIPPRGLRESADELRALEKAVRRLEKGQARGVNVRQANANVLPPSTNPADESKEQPENEAGGPSLPPLDGNALTPTPQDPSQAPNLGARYMALLRNLQTNGPGLENALGNLQKFLRSLGTTAIELALFTHIEGKTKTRRRFFLKVVGPNGFQNMIIPSDSARKGVDFDVLGVAVARSKEREKRAKNAGILEWIHVGEGSERTEEPQYVLCLGEMYVRKDNFAETMSSWEIDEIKSTNYFVMLDALTFKALWLVGGTSSTTPMTLIES